MSNPPIQPIYTVIIEQNDGKWVEFEKFTSLTYSHVLNDGSTASLKCPLNYDKVTPLTKSPRNTWLRVFRQDAEADDRKLIWYGQLINARYGGNDAEAEIELMFENVTNILNSRLVASDYVVTSPTDQSAIMWDLLSITQAKTGGDLSITQGAQPTSKDRTAEKELQDRTIKNVFNSYTSIIDGVDYEITPTPKNEAEHIFNTYFSGSGAKFHKGEEIQTPLVYWKEEQKTHRENNISTFSITEDGINFANSVLAKGATLGDVQLNSTAQDTVSIGVYGLFEKINQENDVSTQDRLDDKATEEVNSTSQIPYNISLSLMPHVNPRVGDYDVGDIFNVKIHYYEAIDLERQYRLYAMQITIDRDGVERTGLTLGII